MLKTISINLLAMLMLAALAASALAGKNEDPVPEPDSLAELLPVGDSTDIRYIDGNLGIGTASPTSQLEVWGDVKLAAAPNAKMVVRIGDPIGGNDNNLAPISLFGSAQSGWGNTYMGIDSPDGVFYVYPMWATMGKFNKLKVVFDGTGTGVLSVVGNGEFTGTVTTGSSRELKNNIAQLTGDEAVEALMSLMPVKYNYKADSDELELGFIAEDVPELVARNDRKSLSPMDFAALSVTVIQQQQEQISDQQAQIDELKALVTELIDGK